MLNQSILIYSIALESGLERNFGEVARVPTISERKAGTDGHERRGRKPKESEEGEKAGGWRREMRERRTPATSAARFNYTLQTHDMSKSYTSYRLRHLLKVSSRAPRSRHRCSAARPLLSGIPRKHIGRKARNIRTKSSRKERGEERGVLLRLTQLQRPARR